MGLRNSAMPVQRDVRLPAALERRLRKIAAKDSIAIEQLISDWICKADEVPSTVAIATDQRMVRFDSTVAHQIELPEDVDSTIAKLANESNVSPNKLINSMLAQMLELGKGPRAD